MKKIKLMILISVFSLAISKNAFSQSVQSLSVNVNTLNPYLVPDDFFSAVTVTSVGDFDYTDPVFKKLVDSCGIKTLYYPGGSVARWAHYSPGVLGYGISTVQATSLGYTINTQPWYVDQLGATNNFLEECLQMAQDLNQGIIICANVMTGYLSDLSNIITACNSYSVAVKSVIFNTEVDLSGDRAIFPGAKAYLDSISKYVTFMQTNYPNIPLSVDATDHNNTFRINWNDSVANSLLSGITPSRGAQNWHWHAPYTNTITANNRDAVFDYEKNDMLNYFNQVLPIKVDTLNNHFNGMDVVQMDIDFSLSDYTGQLPNTLFAEIYFMKRIFWMINYNATNTPFFKSASIMKLSSNTSHDPIWHTSSTSTVINTSTTFDSYVLMKQIHGSSYTKPTVTGLSIGSNLESFYFTTANLNYLYFINLDTVSYSSNSINVNGIAQSSYSVNSIFGQNNKLYAANSGSVLILKTNLNNQNSVVIPPHSIVIIKMQAPSTTGIHTNINHENLIKLYPIPSNNFLNVETPIKADKIIMYDVLGKQLNVITPTSSTQKIDISTYNNGAYYLKFIFDKNEINKKFIINK